MSHIDLILNEQSATEIRISIVGDVLPSGPISERIIVDRSEVNQTSEQITRDLLDWANRPAGLRPGPPIRQTMARSGMALFQALFGPVGDILRELKRRWESSERYCIVHLDEGMAGCPVELCHDGDAFLGETFLMGRSIATSRGHRPAARPDGPPFRFLLLINPSEDPCLGDSAEEELDGIRKALKVAPGADPRVYMGKAVDSRLLDQVVPGAAVVHFVGHADDPGDSPGRGGWRLFAKQWYGAERIDRLQNPPFLVFANACATARSEEWTSPASLVRAFLERGTSAYIGTWWEVGSPFAAQFAAAFYRALMVGSTVGSALAAARRQTLAEFGPDEAAWASYVLYGDPRTRLPLVTDARSAGRRARWIGALAGILVAGGILFPTTLSRWTSPPPEPELPTEVRMGYLTFESEPQGALVWVDGESRGRTPLTLELPEGAHDVALELPGRRRWEASALVDPAKPQVVRIHLEETR